MAPSYYISKILLLILLRFLLLKAINADSQPNYIFTICAENGNYTQDSMYKKNLYQVLSDLGTQPLGTTFYNSTRGESPDKVYGMFYCRADINPPLCRACVQEAAKLIVNFNCTKQKEGAIWFQECTLRYADRRLTSLNEDFPPTSESHSLANVSNPGQFHQVVTATMNNLIQKVAKNNTYHGYATAEAVVPFPPSNTLYSLVQCTPDTLGQSCERCLLEILRFAQTLFEKSIWVMIFRPNCQLRYDTVPFYAIQSPSPSSQQPSKSQGKSILFYIAIVVPASGFILLLLCIIAFCVYRRKKKHPTPAAAGSGTGPLNSSNGEYYIIQQSNSTESLQFNLETIKSATGNFSIDNKLGEGGFGPVYKGRLPDGQIMAVKRLSKDSCQGLREFTNEVQLVAQLQHKNLVKLLGFCLEEKEKLLVYEFVSNLSLDRFLFDLQRRKSLNWETRFKIIIGIARGLLYLHEDSRVKIIHRDLKVSNILLDEEMNPKIADFGTARLVKMDHTQANTSKVFGTFGYMAPEYAAAGVFSIKSDVYSFGVMLLEIISAESNNCFTRSHGKRDSLISHAWILWNTGNILELVDPSLGNDYSRTEVLRCIQVGLFCVQEDPSSRPTMESALLIIQNNSSDVQFQPRLSAVSSDMKVLGEHVKRQQDQLQSLESDPNHSRDSNGVFKDLYHI